MHGLYIFKYVKSLSENTGLLNIYTSNCIRVGYICVYLWLAEQWPLKKNAPVLILATFAYVKLLGKWELR